MVISLPPAALTAAIKSATSASGLSPTDTRMSFFCIPPLPAGLSGITSMTTSPFSSSIFNSSRRSSVSGAQLTPSMYSFVSVSCPCTTVAIVSMAARLARRSKFVRKVGSAIGFVLSQWRNT
jgi:hypothetical protein